jgi:hypothetical protein
LGRKCYGDNGSEVPDECAFNEPNFVVVGLIVDAVGDGVWYWEWVVGEFQR